MLRQEQEYRFLIILNDIYQMDQATVTLFTYPSLLILETAHAFFEIYLRLGGSCLQREAQFQEVKRLLKSSFTIESINQEGRRRARRELME